MDWWICSDSSDLMVPDCNDNVIIKHDVTVTSNDAGVTI